MKQDDIDFIVELGGSTEELSSGEDSFLFNKKNLKNWLKWKDKKVYVFEKNNEKIGFAMISIDKTMAEIVGLVIKEEYRNNGIGTYVMENIINDLEEKENVSAQMLYTGIDNEKAQNFYSKIGFEKGKEVITMLRFKDD